MREAIAARLVAADGLTGRQPASLASRMVLTAGSNQLLQLVADTLLDPGDIVLCATPSYFVFMATLASVGARTIGVEIDVDGMIPEALEQELARCRAAGELARVKAIYLVTYYDNPAGITIPLARRQKLVEIARRWSSEGTIFLIEDAAYRELRYYGEEVPSLIALHDEGKCVIHAGTFSKPLLAGHPCRLGHFAQRAGRAAVGPEGKCRFRLAPFQPGVDGQSHGFRSLRPPRGCGAGELSPETRCHTGRPRR